MRILIAILLLLPLPATAQSFPALYDVQRVASHDTLNIRSGPGTRYSVIGELPYNATEIEVIRGEAPSGWGLINYNERSGWVKLTYMRRSPGTRAWDATPTGIAWCGGTEPFWNIQSAGGVLTMSNLGTPVFTAPSEPLVSSAAGNGRAVALAPNGGGMASMVVLPQSCSDGMSDREYGLAAHVTTRLPGEGTAYWTGCCSVAR